MWVRSAGTDLLDDGIDRQLWTIRSHEKVPPFGTPAMRRSINTSQIRILVFRILQEVVGYFCTKQSLRFWRFRLGWLQSGLPGAVCADGFAHGTGAGESRNLVAVRWRFGHESHSFVQ